MFVRSIAESLSCKRRGGTVLLRVSPSKGRVVAWLGGDERSGHKAASPVATLPLELLLLILFLFLGLPRLIPRNMWREEGGTDHPQIFLPLPSVFPFSCLRSSCGEATTIHLPFLKRKGRGDYPRALERLVRERKAIRKRI